MTSMKNNTKKRMVKCLAAAFVLVTGVLVSACSDDAAEPMEEQAQRVSYETFPNGNFEEGMKGWNASGDVLAVSLSSDGCDGSTALRIAADGAHQATVSQTVTGLEDGYYDLWFYLKNSSGEHKVCYLAAGGDNEGECKMTALQRSKDNWCKSVVRGIKVSGGKMNVELYVDADSASECEIDGLRLVKNRKAFNLLMGGDMSYVKYLEKRGVVLKDENGNPIEDIYKYVKQKGFNTIRLRAYVDPGNPNFEASSQIEPGCQDTEDILEQCRRAKAAGLKVMLTLHYSDTWSNPGQQIMPHEWEGLSWEQLQDALYNYTKDVMTRLHEQGTDPEFVAVGNETQSGICFPVADWNNYDKTAVLYSRGYDAIKEVSPETQVVVHVSNGGDWGYKWFFGMMREYGAKFDIIGISYYPFNEITGFFNWQRIHSWAEAMYNEFGKETIVMETGYNFSPKRVDGVWDGSLSGYSVYQDIYPYTRQGQKDYLNEAINEMKMVDDCHILGFYYWDPLVVHLEGDKELNNNQFCNEAFFDFEHKALPVFDAYTYNN